MTTYLPAYRLTLYAPRSEDATEATVLSPRAGAPHSDAFKISTLPNLAGYKPYLADVPTGRTGRIDVLNKRTDVGQLTFTLLDHILTAGNQSQRWMAAFFGDAFGRSRWLGLKAVCDESLDGGLTWNASGQPYWTGRVQNLKASDKLTFDLSVNDMSEDLKALVGVGLPHVNVQSYAGVLSLLPIGPQVTYGLLLPPRPFTAVASTPASWTGMLVTLDPEARAWITNVVTEELLAAATPTLNNTPLGDTHVVPNADGPLRVQIRHTSGANAGLTGIYKVGYYTTSVYGGGTMPGSTQYVGNLGIYPLDDATAPGYLALPANGVTLQILATYRDAQVSDTQPLLINDQHPVQHLKDIANGYYGWLYKPGETRPAGKNIGDAKRSVAINAAAFATLLADTSFPLCRLWLTDVEPGSDVIEKYLCQGYQLGYYFDGAGQLTPVDLRVPTTTPSLALTDTDVVAAESFSWALERDNSVQRVNARYYYDYQVPVEGRDALPSIGKTVLYPIECLLEVLEVGSADLGDQALDIDALGYRYMDGEVVAGTATGDMNRADYERAKLAESARCLTYPFGSGGVTCQLELRRTANGIAVTPGALLLLTVSWLPDPWTNQRGGTRVMRCLELTKNGATLTGRFLDYGSGAVAGVPTLGAPAQQPFNTSHAAQVLVTSNAQGDDVELQVAVTLGGSVPGATDPGWHTYGPYPVKSSSAPPWSLTAISGGLPAGGRIWFRGRSRPGALNRMQQASAWVYSTSVDLVGLTAPSALSTSAIGSTVFSFAFTVGSVSTATQVLLALPNQLDQNDFEVDAVGTVAVGPAAISRDNTHAFTGTWAMKVVTTAAAGNQGIFTRMRSGARAAVAGGESQTYTVRVFADASSTGKTWFADVDWYTAGAVYLSTSTGGAVVLSAGWNALTVTAYPPAGAATADLYLVENASVVQTVWLDAPQWALTSGLLYRVVTTLPPGTTSYTLTGLDPGTTVGLQVRHTDGAGGYSGTVGTTVTLLAAGSDTALPALTGFILTQYTP